MQNKTTIYKKHIGRPVDFRGCGDYQSVIFNGRIVAVKNHIATIEHGVSGSFDTFTARIETNSPRIVEIW
jgi:hypothetical protein